MPEIKNEFTSGKMNKDLDERLVPKGEYRHAMNIQVSTSEESEVGTVQNILGNEQGCSDTLISPFSYTVGSVSDEKDDSLYWFISGLNMSDYDTPGSGDILQAINQQENLSQILLDFENGDQNIMSLKDMIVRKKTDESCEPVFVDSFAFLLANNDEVYLAGPPYATWMIGVEKEITDICEPGWKVRGIDSSGNGLSSRTITTIKDVTAIPFTAEFTVGYTPVMQQLEYAFQIENIGSDAANPVYKIVRDKILVRPVVGDVSTFNPIAGATINLFHPFGQWDPVAVSDTNTNNVVVFTANIPVGGPAGGFVTSDLAFGGTVYGCTDPTATNYDPNATIDNGSCFIADDEAADDDTVSYGSYNLPISPILYSADGAGGGSGAWTNVSWVQVDLAQDINLFSMFNDFSIMPDNVDAQYVNINDNPAGPFAYSIPLGTVYGNASWMVPDPDGQPTGELVVNSNFDDISVGDELSSFGNMNYDHTLDLVVGSKFTRTNNDGTFDDIITIEDSSTSTLQVPFMQWGSTGVLVFKELDFKTIVLSPPPSNWGANGDNVAAYLFYGEEKRVLKFNRNRLITGVNIIDDMLFWTDNFSEPKKINIPDSIEGTNPNGTIHTRVVNKKLSPPLGLKDINITNIELPVKEQHITVIKQSPKAKLVLDLETDREIGENYTGIMRITTQDYANQSSFTGSSAIKGRYDFSGLETTGANDDTDAENTISFNIESDLDGNDNFTLNNWKEGSTIILKEFDEEDNAPIPPITDYSIKGVISEWQYNRFTGTSSDKARVKIEITSIKGNPSGVGYGDILKNYAVDLFDQNPKTLFQYKFPRFSYRYRYRDGEYSTFAPFTEIAFIPGSFDYHVKKGYNLGMTNRLRTLRLKNFITSDMPEDVVSIDLLYKDDASTNIYIVDTISPTDQASDGGMYNDWVKNRYKLTSDTIRAVIPSNQLLRAYDNVPRKALAQDIVGNRIVYGNYVQGYDMIADGKEFSPVFKHYLSDNNTTGLAASQSIKSLRDYQIGVVFTDKYGRETPVLTNNSGAFKIDKLESPNRNKLNVKLRNNSFPKDVTHFKFFIKETSGEYYNLPMDRWYDADDGNIWLSFQSSDVNKIDLDTYIVLKKGEDSTSLVEESARYKVLAISDQAPEHIKKEVNNIGKILQGVEDDDGDSLDDRLFVSDSDWPLIGGKTFVCNKNRLGKGNSLYGIVDIKETLYVEFRQGSKISERYKITMVSRDRIAGDVGDVDGDFGFTVERPFESDISFIFEGSSTAPQGIFSDVSVVFYKEEIINSPKFDGKFFVKIYSDEVFYKNIGNIYDIQDQEYNILGRKKIYLLPGDLKKAHNRNDYKAFGDENWFYDLVRRGSSDWDAGLSEGSISGAGPFLSKMRDVGGEVIGGGMHNRRHFWQTGMAQHPSDFQYWRAFFKHDISSVAVKWGGIGTMFSTVPEANADVNLPFDPDKSTYEEFSNGVDDDNFRKRMPTTWHPAFGATPGTKTANFTTDMFDCMLLDRSLRNDAENGYEDVYFIDAGQYKGVHGSDWRRWAHETYGPSGKSKSGRKTSTGITNYGSSNDGKMELAIGPIRQESGLMWMDYDDDFENENFWTFDRQDWYESNSFFDRFTPGARFRWKEDPTGTIYTVYGSTARRNRLRYLSYRKIDQAVGDESDLAKDSISSHRRKAPFTHLAENHTKGFKSYFKPRMQWNPQGSGEGVISGSRKINKIKTTADGSPANLMSDGTFGENWLRIDQNNFQYTYDSEYNERAPLEIGMMLYRIGTTQVTSWTDNTGKLLNPLIIKDINRNDNGYYYIYFNGYDRASLPTPLNDGSSPGFSGTPQALDFRQPKMNGLSENSRRNINYYSNETLGQFNINSEYLTPTGTEHHIGIAAIGYTLEFVVPIEREKPLPTNPSVWETEPKEGTDLDIYYEITENNPVYLTQETAKTAFPIGSEIYINEGGHWDPDKTVKITGINEQEFDRIRLSHPVCGGGSDCVNIDENNLVALYPGSYIKIKRPSGILFTAKVADVGSNVGHDDAPSEVAGSFVQELKIEHDLYRGNHRLNWHNCFSFGNGVESNRIGDTFNMPFISNGVKASSTLEERYEEERRKHGLIYSGIYNSTSGVNNLNQFIQAEKITKDINPIYGSIQKLHMRDSNLVTLCEDKVLKILAHKDALFNADGNQQLTATDKVLGQATPFVGEYGISKNPESFASESYRAYFTDKVRGSVLRLSMDGLTPISEAGMKDYFKDNLKLNNNLIGSYDDKKQEYNITLQQSETTVTFREDAGGWVSFKSFVPESGVSCANEYYTFKNGQLWQHHKESVDRNTFYNSFIPSSFNAIMNEGAGIIKTFNTLNYEGSQAKVDQLLSYDTFAPGTSVVTATYSDNEYYNLQNKDGWFVEHIKTDLEEGTVNEFIKKEGKYFNYIKGKVGSINNSSGVIQSGFDNADNSFQGLGVVTNAVLSNAFGCTDPLAFNHNDSASVDDGSCIDVVSGCTDPLADAGYDVSHNTDDGSCIYYGCTDSTATNYNAAANTNDGSCIATVLGCTDSSTFTAGSPPTSYYSYINYDSLANVDDGSCIATVLGCDNPAATNYNANVNTNDGSCVISVQTCNDINACNYDPQGDQDGYTHSWDAASYCLYCGDNTANNFDGATGSCISTCEYCILPTPNVLNLLYKTTSQVAVQVTLPNASNAATASSVIFQYYETSNPGVVTTQSYNPVGATPGGTYTYVIVGLQDNTEYTINYKIVCSNTESPVSDNLVCTTDLVLVNGCTDINACNYDSSANNDDGSCDFATCAGCTDPAYLEYCNTCWDAANFAVVPEGTGGPWQLDDGSCSTLIINGCTDSTALNFDPAANVDDGSCVAVVLGCTDDTLGVDGAIAATNYDPNANTDDGSCTYETSAITGSWIFNTNAGVLINAEYIVTVGNIPVGSIISNPTNNVGQSNNPSEGFSSNLHSSYYSGDQTAISGVNTYSLAIVPESAITPNALAGLIYMNLDLISVNYNGFMLSGGMFSGGGGELITIGCTDPAACNYDSTAIIDDGSCVMPDGCGDSNALNYDNTVTCPDDNDCVYCATDPGITNATLSFNTSIVNANITINAAEINWSGYNNTNTNGTFQSQDGNLNVYKVEYRYKLPGQSYSAWTSVSSNSSNCNGNYYHVQLTYGLSVTGSEFVDMGYGLSGDGRFNAGTKWRFRIRNLCTNCNLGPGGITTWSPVFTLSQDIISTF